MVKRYVAVAVFSLLSIVAWAPDVTRAFGHPLATLGFTVGRGAAVLTVDRGSPAQHAGVRPDARIHWRATPLESRIFIVASSLQTLLPREAFSVALNRSGRPETVNVATQPETPADISTVIPRCIFGLMLLASGIGLVLLRPSKATWGFFFFAASSPAAPVNTIIWWGPPIYQLSALIAASIFLPMVSLVGAIVFALYLLRDAPLERWRLLTEKLTYLIAIALLVFISWNTVLAVYSGVSLEIPIILTLALELCGVLAVPIILLATYSGSDGAIRERLRWVLLGFSINAVILALLFVTSQPITFLVLPYWVFAVLSGISTALVVSTVLYGVLKHHVMDINIAISRAVVYTILSAIIVAIFALVDLFFTRIVSGGKSGLIAEMALALILGYFFNGLHHHVDRFVDNLLFKRRHLAEQHVRMAIQGMPFAISESQVDAILIEEPCRCFGLVGAALLAREELLGFILRCAFGLSIGPSRLAAEDALPMFLRGQGGALRLDQSRWNVQALAVPVLSHGDLAAIIFYGAHESGTDFDAEEITLLEQLAAAAGTAYDRLEANRVREELRLLRLTHT